MAHAYTIDLSKEDRDYLRSLTRQRTIQAQVVDRAKTLLYKGSMQNLVGFWRPESVVAPQPIFY